jgi:hypothetical protein
MWRPAGPLLQVHLDLQAATLFTLVDVQKMDTRVYENRSLVRDSASFPGKRINISQDF